MTGVEREDGVALLIAMMTLLLMTALGAALILTSSVGDDRSRRIFETSLEARYAAGAMIERGIDDVGDGRGLEPADRAVCSASSWVDGAPPVSRTLADGSTIDLAQALNLANCQKSAACSAGRLAAGHRRSAVGREQPAVDALRLWTVCATCCRPGVIDVARVTCCCSSATARPPRCWRCELKRSGRAVRTPSSK